MDVITKTERKDEKGFTLVELAIVMIIIGLLIGGILKGQELIANAQVTSTVAQIKGIEAAASTFRDMYNAMPGDITNPGVRLPGCGAEPCSTAGNGDGRVTAAPGAVMANNEGLRFWTHLNAVDLLTGIDGTATIAWGAGFPAASIAGGFGIGFAADADGMTGETANAVVRGGHYIAMYAAPATAIGAIGNASLSATQAARIDRKMDDGMPKTGSVLAGGPTACAEEDAGSPYLEATDAVACNLFIRIQG